MQLRIQRLSREDVSPAVAPGRARNDSFARLPQWVFIAPRDGPSKKKSPFIIFEKQENILQPVPLDSMDTRMLEVLQGHGRISLSLIHI